MILVLGATGVVGGEVTRQLIGAGHRPRLLVRDPARAREHAADAEIVQGDLAVPASLGGAFAGVDALFLMSGTHGGIDAALELNAIEAARAAGVRHVVKLSVVGAEAPFDTFGRQHAEVEARLRESGLAWTMLRPHFFMSNTLRWAGSIRRQSLFHYPTGGGRWPAVDPRDIGAVAVRALTQPGHEGCAYTLSGPESLSAADYARKLSAVLGRPVQHVNVPLEAVRDELAREGMPPAHAAPLLDLLAALAAGRVDAVADGVERVTGRPPGDFEAWARRNAAAFL